MLKGFININKPRGVTSSDVVVGVRRFLRKATGEPQKVGHMGTLDPEAIGVLPIALGSAAKLFDYFIKKEKQYIAEFTFNITTDTLDSAGKVTETRNVKITKDAVLIAAKTQVGEIMQMPPQYSALSVGGVRAYDLAREGKTADLKPRAVTVNDVEYIDHEGEKYTFKIDCLGGTYIRSIARDIATELGTVGYMSALLRTKSGVFTLDKSVTLEEFYSNPFENVIGIDECLPYPAYRLADEYALKARNGVVLSLDDLPMKGLFKVYVEGELFSLAENDRGNLRVLVRL
jgi:tRNA pseudouridine55 synthase